MKKALPSIVGVAGTNGAGKDSLAAILQENGDYYHASSSDALRHTLDEQQKPHTRENMSALSQSIRATEGEGALVQRLLDLHADTKRLCITSLRAPGEAEAIQRQGGVVIWVDADPEVRYERVNSGQRHRVTDQVSFEEFMTQEANEMTPSEAGGGLNMAGVRERADYRLENNYTSFSDLKQAFEKVFTVA